MSKFASEVVRDKEVMNLQTLFSTTVAKQSNLAQALLKIADPQDDPREDSVISLAMAVAG
jgi:hypothetical protein